MMNELKEAELLIFKALNKVTNDTSTRYPDGSDRHVSLEQQKLTRLLLITRNLSNWFETKGYK